MKNRGLLIATVVLAGLIALLYWSNRQKPDEEDPGTLSTDSVQLLSFNESDITRLSIKPKTGDQIELVREGEGNWQIAAPTRLGADQEAVNSMLSTLSSLNSERLIEEKATNFGRYGLEPAELEMLVTDKNNVTHKLLLGSDAPVGGGAFARLDGDPRVFKIAGYSKTSLAKGLEDLRDKRLITVAVDKVSRLELRANNQQIEFGRDKDRWQILKPGPYRADQTSVDELLNKLSDAKMESDEETDKAKTQAAYASGTPVATAKVTTDTGVQELEVRKKGEEYYARSSVVSGVFKVAADLGQALDKKLTDFRDKRIFELEYSDLGKLEIRDGTKVHYLTKGGDDWWSAEGKKFDTLGAQSLVDKIIDLEATEFASSGFTTTALELVATSADGKRIEKASLSPGSKNPLARREGETTLYVLDSEAIKDLQKLISGLKLEEASAK